MFLQTKSAAHILLNTTNLWHKNDFIASHFMSNLLMALTLAATIFCHFLPIHILALVFEK